MILAGCASVLPGPAPTGPATSSVPTASAASSLAVPTRGKTSAAAPSGGSTSAASPLSPVGSEVKVNDAATLTAALAAARPGVTITLADGTYNGDDVQNGNADEPGRFYGTVPGTATAPITLRGTRQAVLDGGGPDGGYGLHLVKASYWRLEGFTVSSSSKGIVLDGSSHVRISRVRVTDIGAEGVHFRSFSSDNVLEDSDVDHTGVSKPNFGEGVYIGSAVSNWGSYSGGSPDMSDRNQVLGNRIVATGAENIDIKEGSSGGIIRGNTFDGSEIAGKNSADSWIDVKGNGYTIESNRGTQSLLDGFQVHVLVEGWGRANTFSNNTLDVRAPGVGIWLQNKAVDQQNIIRCSNVVSSAAAGDYATNHYTKLACVR